MRGDKIGVVDVGGGFRGNLMSGAPHATRLSRGEKEKGP